LARVWSISSPRTSDAFAAIRQRLQHQLAGILAELGIGRTDIGDPLRLRRIGVGGEQDCLLGYLVEPFGLVLGIDGTDHDGGSTRRNEILHDALLNGGGRLFRIFELQVVVGQLALRLLDAGFGNLPEI
jgi:hypothetical protein